MSPLHHSWASSLLSCSRESLLQESLQSDIGGGEAPATDEAEAGPARQPIGAWLAGDSPDGFLLTKMEELQLAEANCLLSGRANGVSGGWTLDERCWGTRPVRSLVAAETSRNIDSGCNSVARLVERLMIG